VTLDASAFLATGSSPAAGKYDLLTVLLHETGHLLGFNPEIPSFRAHVGTIDGSRIFVGPGFTAPLSEELDHIDNAALPYDLMNALLAPGIRKLPSALDVQIINTVRNTANLAPVSADAATSITSYRASGISGTVSKTLGDPADPNAGWTSDGSVSFADGRATLSEDPTVLTSLSKSFTVPDGLTQLVFTLNILDFRGNGIRQAPDAFEVALLDSDTLTPLVGTAAGLSQTGAFLNIQQNGEVYFGPQVTVTGATNSGAVAAMTAPITVTVDLSGIEPGTHALLAFDLLGFGSADSSVTIQLADEILVAPTLTGTLDPAFDTGLTGDNTTRIAPVTVIGTTDANQQLILDIDGDGFDDGTTTADATGQFSFANVPLVEGVNELKVRATNDAGTTDITLAVALDSQTPVGSLVSPTPSSISTQDAGFVDVQWNDPGNSGLDTSSFGPSDVLVSDVTIDAIEILGPGLVRYHYNLDGDQLTPGQVQVTLVANAVSDKAGNSSAAETESFEIPANVNRAPLATADSYSTPQGQTLAVSVLDGVLANDSDPDQDALSADLAQSPSHGSVDLHSDGSFNYIPAVGFSGLDQFRYRASDGLVGSQEVVVTINVSAAANLPPVPTADSYSIAEDAVLVVDAVLGVLSNDTDPDGGTLTVTLESGASHGTLALQPNGSFAYTPAADFNGSDQFSYRVSDGGETSEPVIVTISVTPENDAPLAYADSYSTREGEALNIAGAGLLANDSDIDQDLLSAELVQAPSNGSLDLHADGSFTYTPAVGFHGFDQFRYRATDGGVASSEVVVTVEVTPAENRPPVPATDSYSIAEDGLLAIATELGLLANDTDPDGDALLASLESPPSHGSLVLQPNGSFTYTPAADFNGFDQFQYRVGDADATSEPVTVTIRVTAQNDAPIASSDHYSADEDETLHIPTAAGLLVNDRDIDNDSLNAVIVTAPSHGNVTLNPDGSFVYTPKGNFVGLDEFTYRASDGQSTSADMKVTINVVPRGVTVQNCSATVPDPESGAGKVGVKVSKGLMTLRGDGAFNAIRLEVEEGGTVVVTGLGGTKVNGRSGAVRFRSVRSVDIGMGSGNDTLSIEPGPALIDAILDRGLTIRMDAGDDRLSLCGVAVSGPVKIGAGLGSDIYMIDDADFHGPAVIGSGDAADTILIETHGDPDGPPTYFRDETNINGKGGRDRIRLGKGERGNTVKFQNKGKRNRPNNT
jgi:VCBS repeat-containing protein